MKICTKNGIEYDVNKWKSHYFKYLSREYLAENTMHAYTHIINKFCEYLYVASDITCLKELGPSVIEDFLSAMEMEYRERINDQHFTYSPTSRRLYIIIIKLFTDYIEENAEIDDEGMHTFSPIYKSLWKRRGRKHLKGKDLHFLSDDEVMNLVSYLDLKIEEDGGHFSYTYSLLIKLMLFGGLRVSEALSVKMKDVSLINSEIMEIKISDSKSGLVQYVPVKVEHIGKEYFWLKEQKEDDMYLLSTKRGGRLNRSNMYRVVNNAYREAGVKKKGLHTLRHTAAMLLLEKSSDVTMVQQLLRHSDISTTMIYVHRSSSQLAKQIV